MPGKPCIELGAGDGDVVLDWTRCYTVQLCIAWIDPVWLRKVHPSPALPTSDGVGYRRDMLNRWEEA